MCGIAGILRVHSPGAEVPPVEESIPEAWLDLLDESIRHRGPDAQGRFRDRVVRADSSVVDVALVHRRMSVIDLAGGAQPMVSAGREGDPSARPQRARSASAGLDDRAYRGLPLPALFHGGPDDRVAYRPIENARDDLIAVAFNGCIYNHRELRAELESLGHLFETDHSDTEVLIHGWREWHRHLFTKTDGMFAIALWDRRDARLFALRDVAGEKPLYVAHPTMDTGRALVFASVCEPVVRLSHLLAPDHEKAQRRWMRKRVEELERAGADADNPVLLESRPKHPKMGVPYTQVNISGAELNHWRSMLARPLQGSLGFNLNRVLSRGWGEYTVFLTAQNLKPATYAVSEPDQERGISSGDVYYRTTMQTKELRKPPELDIERVEQLLSASVAERLDADVPLGCFLSGGIDSGLIAAFAQRRLAETGSRLRTFTVRMPDRRFDESDAAARTAEHLRTDHATLDCSTDAASDLVWVIRHLGQPFGDSSILPTLWLCREVRKHVRVALSGDGGDELFGGYERHRAAMWIPRYGRVAQLAPLWLLGLMSRSKASERVRRFVSACRYGGYEELLQLFDAVDYARLTRGEPDPDDTRFFEPGPLTEDFSSYLPFDLLCKADTASMSVALEVRAPFLDFDLVRSAHVTPIATIMPHGERKGLLKQVARRHLPPDIVDRPKMGFAIPVGEWFRSDYGGMRQLLLDHLTEAEPFGPDSLGINAFINMDFVRRMLREHDDAGEGSIWPWKGRDHSQRLYMLLVLSIWAKWVGGLKQDRAENV